jgi:hypothetical protein
MSRPIWPGVWRECGARTLNHAAAATVVEKRAGKIGCLAGPEIVLAAADEMSGAGKRGLFAGGVDQAAAVVEMRVGEKDGGDLLRRHADGPQVGGEPAARVAEGGAAAGVDQHEVALGAHEQHGKRQAHEVVGHEGFAQGGSHRVVGGGVAIEGAGDARRHAAVAQRHGLDRADFEPIVTGLPAAQFEWGRRCRCGQVRWGQPGGQSGETEEAERVASRELRGESVGACHDAAEHNTGTGKTPARNTA